MPSKRGSAGRSSSGSSALSSSDGDAVGRIGRQRSRRLTRPASRKVAELRRRPWRRTRSTWPWVVLLVRVVTMRRRALIRGVVGCAVLFWLALPSATVSAGWLSTSPPTTEPSPTTTTTTAVFLDTTTTTMLPYAQYLSAGLELARFTVVMLVAAVVFAVFVVLRRKPAGDAL
jgi:hypothetical protein